MNSYIHATDLIHLQNCPRLAWMNHSHQISALPYANNTQGFSALYQKVLHLQNTSSGHRNDSPDTSLRILRKEKKGMHLRFESCGIRTQIPVLVQISRLFEMPAVFECFQKLHAAAYGYALLEAVKTDAPAISNTDITDSESTATFLNPDPSYPYIYKQDSGLNTDRERLKGDEACQSLPDSSRQACDENSAPWILASQAQAACSLTDPVRKYYAAIYPHLSKAPGLHEADLMAVNQAVARENGIDIVHHQVLYVNPDYVRQKELDPAALIQTSASFFKKAGHPMRKTIDQILAEKKLDLPAIAAQARSIFSHNMPDPVRCKLCVSPRKCGYYEACFSEEKYPDDHISFLFSCHHKSELEKAGIESMADVPPAWMDGFALQYAQIQAARNYREAVRSGSGTHSFSSLDHAGMYMDRHAVSRWIEKLEYPLIYLDFEWDTFALPPYPGMKPFDVLCFQYSMHVEEKDGSLRHYNFFSGGDCRERFIDTLIERIPKTGTILVYNMEGAEKLRLMQLAEQFPARAADLEQIWSRMTDLSVLFETGACYDLQQRGRFSLKSVLPVFDPSNGYAVLDVHDGLEAIAAYRRHESASTEEEREKIAESISRYCEMDTRAEVEILHGLMRICEKE